MRCGVLVVTAAVAVGSSGCGNVDDAEIGPNQAGTFSGGDDAADGSGDDHHEAPADGTAGTGAGDGGGMYHPPGFAEPDVHGLAAKLAEEDCRACHGNDLAGGVTAPISCDSCHESGWRTDCTYCHGGEQTMLGAPPRDIDGSSEPTALSFMAHTAHVTDGVHAAFDCSQCHRKPTDVLSDGHLFDGTPGAAEVDFSTSLSPEGQWAAGQCGNLYCHGNGNGTLGAFVDTGPAPGCGDCHSNGPGSAVAVSTMSGRHALHVSAAVTCRECHAATVDAAGTIVQPLLHVNGFAEVAIADAGVTFDGTSCTGLCHAKLHFAQTW